MIDLDTHGWLWWVDENPRLPNSYREHIQSQESNGLGISAITCWEVAKLVEGGRLKPKMPVDDWLRLALAYPGIILLDLTPRIAVESTMLPPPFHRDPADQIIVATARVHDCPLVTLDARILRYPHVKTAPEGSPSL